MTYTQTIDPTEFWSWKKVEAGHYVLTTDTRYTATVHNRGYHRYYRSLNWELVVVSPSGDVWKQRGAPHIYATMAQARHVALIAIKELMDTDLARWNPLH